jgi:ATP-dependent DNA ligase
MSDTILAYFISLGIIGAGGRLDCRRYDLDDVRALHRCRRDDHCRRVDQLHDRVSQPDALDCRHMLKAFEFCIPTRSTIVPDGPDWLHEVKYDGCRLRKPGH